MVSVSAESTLQPRSVKSLLLPSRRSQTDPVTFEALLSRYERPMRQFAFRLLGSQQAMEDALQEACLNAFRALPTFRGDDERALRAWLFRIVYHACMDEFRRSPREHLADDAAERSESKLEQDVADQVAERADLASALARLPVEQRAAVLLVDLIGFDYRSAARLLEVPAGTIASRLNHARASLRDSLTISVRHEEGSQ
jgi:RNA polymerase sigma-70 factor, ECF subfamily